MKRVIFDIFLIISIFILPWWFNVILVIIGIFLFDKFYEFIIALIILYSLYSVKSTNTISSVMIASVIINFSYFGIQILKSRIILYK